MINKIKEKVSNFITNTPDEEQQIVIVDPMTLQGPPEPDMRIIGLFTDVVEEKVAELSHALLYLSELNNLQKSADDRKPIEFYISTYGGAADDMFALYDIMRQVQLTTEIHTIGMGKVMSAGVLLLAAGAKGQRKIGKYCRVMIHSAIAGSHGSLPNLMNEMEALQGLQESYIDALVSETKMTKSQIKKMLERKVNVYLSAEEAVKFGIADIII
jgi:ATP-dependent Clp endopeptidase proteolytic subunit ClpP